MVSSINIALPAIGSQFGMGAVLLSWVSLSYLLAAAMFLVPFGRFADIHGRKKVFSCGIGIYTLSSFLIVFSPSAAVFLLLRVMQGFGSAMIFGTGIAIVTSVFPPGERGRVLGSTWLCTSVSPGAFSRGFLAALGWASSWGNVPMGWW
jgi:MFS family permease